MIQSLSIKNVVLIDNLELDFDKGLSVLTGETGAGKSILLDSLGLVLGLRAETRLIRYGQEKLSVCGVFKTPQSKELQEILKELEIDFNDELIIKRSLSLDGKSKISVNDVPITLKSLKELGKYLVEIHGQFDNQGLLNPSNHREVLDIFGGHKNLLINCEAKFNEFKLAHKTRLELEENIKKASLEQENLIHWVDELKKIKPQKGEEDILQAERLEMMNAEKIIESLNFAYQALNSTDVSNNIRQAQSAIAKANKIVNNKYDNIAQILEQALIETIEAISEIELASSNLSVDGQSLESIEERLFALKSLARKHQVNIDDLSDILQNLQTKLDNISEGEDSINKFLQIESEKKLAYLKAAEELSKARKLSASKLDSQVMIELPALKMEKAKFVTIINRLEENLWNSYGFDDVYFSVSTNPNAPQGPINKIASGGELARFMLALKVNLANSSDVATMIFDEVDSGVGGATAQAVGERLAKLSHNVQVLVVTHSPQVAAQGKNHFKVSKITIENITTTNVQALNLEERHEEIARMLAGENITNEARAAAKVLMH